MPITNLNTIRAAFMRRASAPRVSPFALKLAYLIAYKYMNSETGTARPSQETLATDLGGVTVRTVQRMLDSLRPLGLVIVPGHGPNRASTYWIDPDKATPVSPINTTPMSPISGRKGDSRRQRTRHPATEKATPVSPQLKKKNQEEEPREEFKTLAPDLASPDSKPVSTAQAEPKKAPVSGSKPTDTVARFDEFWTAYPRRVAKEAARKAFAAAIKRGADPADIIAGAKRYAIERAGQEPKYTKHPATWLNGGCQEDEAPPGAGPPIIDQHGNPVAEPAQPQRPARPQSVTEAADEWLAEIEANGDTWEAWGSSWRH